MLSSVNDFTIASFSMDDGERELLIVGHLKEASRQAAREIYDAYTGYLAGICARYVSDDDDIKDVLQDSFIKIFSSLNSFSYRGSGSLKAWLAKIVVNQALRFLNGKGKLVFVPIDNNCMDVVDRDIDVDVISESVLLQMVRELPTGYRTVFNLYVFEERSHREIAALLNIKETTSASQFHRAKALLASKIKSYIKDESHATYGR